MKRFCIALLLIGLLMPLCAGATGVSTALTEMETEPEETTPVTLEAKEIGHSEAVSAFLSALYETADADEQIAIAEKAAADAPDDAELLLMVARILYFHDTEGQYTARCEEVLHAVLDIAEGETKAAALEMLAELLIVSERKDEAMALIEQACAENPEDESLRITLAMVLYYSMENTRAVELLEELLEDSPENMEALRLRAAILLDECRYDEALTAYTQLNDQYPEYYDGIYGLYLTYAACGEFEKAARRIDDILRMGGDDSLYVDRARLRLYQQYDPNKAYREAEALMRSDPEDTTGYVLALGACLMLEDYEKALDLADGVAMIDPDFGMLLLGMIAMERGNGKEAERLQSNVTQRNEEYAFAYYCLASTLLEGKNDVEGALDTLAEAFARAGQEDAMLFTLLGGIYEQMRRPEEAARAFGYAHTLATNDAGPLYHLLYLYLDAGREREMIDTLAEMERKYPGWYETMLARVLVEDVTGAHEQALETFGKIKEKFPFPASQLTVLEGVLLASAGQVAGIELIEGAIALMDAPDANDYVNLAYAHITLSDYAAAEKALDEAEAILLADEEGLALNKNLRTTMSSCYATRAEVLLFENDLEGCVKALEAAAEYGFSPTSLSLYGDFTDAFETPAGKALLEQFSSPSDKWDVTKEPEIPSTPSLEE